MPESKGGQKRFRPERMDKNTRYVLVIAIIIGGLLAVVWIYRPRRTEPLPTIVCGDGPRHLIDATQFATKYWAYSLKLEATLPKEAEVGAELEPKQLQQLSEAMQQANEFRKWLVASYNACAVTQSQYAAYGTNFQGMDNVARNIDDALQAGVRSSDDQRRLSVLVNEYVRLSSALHTPTRSP